MLARWGLALIFLFPLASSAENFCQAIFYKKTENSLLDSNNFATGRGLQEYSRELEFRESTSFNELLKELPSQSVWFDMGMGQGHAIRQGLDANPGLEAVGVTYKLPTNKSLADFKDVSHRMTLLEGDYVEVMALKGRLNAWRGRVSLITDVYGPLSYTHDFSRVLQVYMDLLKPGGVIMFNMGMARNFKNYELLPELERINTFVYRGGTGQSALYNWLLHVPGVEVADMVSRRVDFDGRMSVVLSLKIRKLSENVLVPEFQLLDYVEGAPPHRMFVAPY